MRAVRADVPVREKVMQRPDDLYMMEIGDIHRQQIAVHVGIQDVSADGDIFVSRDIQKRRLHGMRRVAVVDDMDTLVHSH